MRLLVWREPDGKDTKLRHNYDTKTRYKDPSGFAMERYAYYVCFKCGKAYFGGEARCDLDAGVGDTFNPEELVGLL